MGLSGGDVVVWFGFSSGELTAVLATVAGVVGSKWSARNTFAYSETWLELVPFLVGACFEWTTFAPVPLSLSLSLSLQTSLFDQQFHSGCRLHWFKSELVHQLKTPACFLVCAGANNCGTARKRALEREPFWVNCVGLIQIVSPGSFSSLLFSWTPASLSIRTDL